MAQAHLLLCFRVEDGEIKPVAMDIYSEGIHNITELDGYLHAEVAQWEGDNFDDARSGLLWFLRAYRRNLFDLVAPEDADERIQDYEKRHPRT